MVKLHGHSARKQDVPGAGEVGINIGEAL